MKPTISFDGIKLTLEPLDLDGDGQTNEIESIHRPNPLETEIVQPGELSESLKEINQDRIDPETRMSAIDMRTRLHTIELPAMIVWDTLIAMRCLPQDLMKLTLKKSRYSISLQGQGRKETRDIIIGKREHDAAQGGFANGIKQSLGMTPKTPQ